MPEELTADDIRNFVLDALKVSGSAYREMDEDLVMAEVVVEIPPMFFDPPRLERQTLNLVFNPESVSKYPGAELVTQGSYRLNWLVEGLRERGNYTLQSVIYSADAEDIRREINNCLTERKTDFEFYKSFRRIHPHLMINYVLSFQTDEITEELVSLGIDMVTGEVLEDFLSVLKKEELSPEVPQETIEEPSLSLEDAFRRIHRYLEATIEKKDPSWIEEPRKRYEEELFFLYQYYMEGKNIQSPEFTDRAKELYDKFRPRVIVRPVNVALLYLPEIIYTTRSGKGTELPAIRYRPVLKRAEWYV